MVPLAIEPLAHFENTTYFVRAENATFNLRISRPGPQSLGSINSEVLLLTALRESGFRVPAPYQNRVVTVGCDQVPEERHVVLFGWMEGTFLRDSMDAIAARWVGQTMADLHNFTETWQPPLGFTRGNLHDWAKEPRQTHQMDKPIDGLSEDDRHFLLDLDAEARAVLTELPRSGDFFGLIHADLHPGNLLVDRGELSVIDFDDCGNGFLLYDFGAALGYLLKYENFQELRDSMLTGYTEKRSLPPRTEELLETFIKIRLSGVSRWILDRVDNPKMREIGPEWVTRFCEGLRKLS